MTRRRNRPKASSATAPPPPPPTHLSNSALAGDTTGSRTDLSTYNDDRYDGRLCLLLVCAYGRGGSLKEGSVLLRDCYRLLVGPKRFSKILSVKVLPKALQHDVYQEVHVALSFAEKAWGAKLTARCVCVCGGTIVLCFHI